MPLALGVAMLAVVIAAALTPNLGTVSAQTNSNYNHSSSSPTGLSTYAWLGIAAVAIIVALLVALLLLRRRRQPPAAAPAAAAGGAPPGAGGPSPPAAPPAAAPAYLETPEDVGQAPPVIPATPPPAAAGGAAAGAAAGGAAAGAEGEPDIDSLMAELDKISGEILKRAPKKGEEPPADGSQGDGGQSR